MKHALRFWRRQPLVALAAIASLGLAIGANIAVFSVLHGTILRPLPFASPEQLVVIWETSEETSRRAVAPANFVDWRNETRSFERLAAFQPIPVTLTGGREAERLSAASASGQLFTLLGVRAAIGRTLGPEDDEAAAESVAVLGDGLWRRLYGGSPTAVGETLTLDGRPHLVVGVLPPGFGVPMAPAVEIWMNGERGVPRSSPFGRDFGSVRDSHMISVIGRLSPGTTIAAARADVAGVMRSLALRHPRTNAGLGASVEPLHEVVVGRARSLVWLLQAAVGLLLVIACANLAHLLLGLAVGRRGEMATRLALGANRRDLVRQRFEEALVLAAPGGALGLLLAAWGLGLLQHLAPPGLPRVDHAGIDAVALSFALVVTLVTAAAFAVVPALSPAGSGRVLSMEAGGRLSGSRPIRRRHNVLIVVELALAQMVLVAAGLLLVSFAQAQRVDLGFEPRGRVSAELSLSPTRYLTPRDPADPDRHIDPAAKLRFLAAVLDRVRREPLVAAAAAGFAAPLGNVPNRGVRVMDEPEPASGVSSAAEFHLVSPGFLQVNGIGLLSGRAIADSDDGTARRVAVVNRAFVDRLMRGSANPIGRVLRFGGNREHEIVGVVADARYRDVERDPEPAFYVPFAQNDERWPYLSLQVAVRLPDANRPAFFSWWNASPDAAVAAVMAALRAAVREADPGQPITAVRTYDETLASAMAPRRFNTVLITVVALTSLLLAAIGIYGVTASAVASRTRELAVRSALGAAPAALERMVLAHGAVLVGLASAIGLTGARLGSGWLESMLFGVASGNAWMYAGVALCLALVALAAVWVPARRAGRVEWIRALDA